MVILAAGAGSRLRQPAGNQSKPLAELAGRTLLEHSVRSCQRAGVKRFMVVVGYRGDLVVPLIQKLQSRLHAEIHPVHNEEWHLGNGSSVLASELHIQGSFFVVMCDHLFDPGFLEVLLDQDDGARICSLVVDTGWDRVPCLEDATKVSFTPRGRGIRTIGKRIVPFDAVDTGVFLCRPPLFDALREAAATDSHSLTAAVRVLAGRGDAGWVSSGGRRWYDVDTLADLEVASAWLLAGSANGSQSPSQRSAYD